MYQVTSIVLRLYQSSQMCGLQTEYWKVLLLVYVSEEFGDLQPELFWDLPDLVISASAVTFV